MVKAFAGREWAAHESQLKPYEKDDLGEPTELLYRCQDLTESAPDLGEFDVEAVLKHRRTAKRGWEFLVKWKGYSSEEATWEKIPAFVPRFCGPWRDYCASHGLLPEFVQYLSAT